VADVRGKLTWRHRFLDIQERTDVFNFYSSSEEILRVDEGFTSLMSGKNTTYVWQIQENFKGRLNSNWLTGIYDSLGGAASDYCGWGFTEEADSQHISDTWGVVKWAPVRPRTLYEKLSLDHPDFEKNFHSLASDPLFRPQPDALFGESAVAFAAGTVASHGSSLDYNTSNDTYPIDKVLIRDWLLAKGFPSRTRPMGSAENSSLAWLSGNFDMASLYITDRNNWFEEDQTYNGEPAWHHSDIQDAPYVHIYRFFDTLTGKEND
jgi:hypothetical protein